MTSRYRRMFVSAVLLTLCSVLFLSACGSSDPTATSAPAATAPPTEAMMAKHEDVQLNFYGTVPTWGEIIEGMNKILRDQDSFITRITLTDMNPDNAMKAYQDASAEQRKTMLIYGLENNVDVNQAGLHPLFKDKPLEPVLMPVISGGPLGCSGHGTWDASLMSLKDISGRKVDQDSSPISPIREEILKALGVLDKAEITFLGGGPRTVETVKNKNVDVDIIHLTGATRPIPPHLQLLTESKTYIVDTTKEGIDGAVKARPDVFKAMYPYPLYKGDLSKALGLSYEPVREPVVYCIGGQNPHIQAGPEMDEAIVYELVSVLMKNREEFRRYVTGDVSSLIKGLPTVVRPQKAFHPGAQKAFEDLGIDYGANAMVELEQARAKEHGQEFYLPDYVKDRL